MALFYFDFRDERGRVPDEEGAQFAHLDDVLAEARASAHDLANQHAHDHAAVGGARVEVRDAAGNTIVAVQVRDILGRQAHGEGRNSRQGDPRTALG